MPGIAGIISAAPAERCRRLVTRMIGAMRIPPPEPHATGILSSHRTCTHVGWVAPENSFAASQSGHDQSAGVQLAFAGECLSLDGIAFHGPKLSVSAKYRARGSDLVPALNGLFSGMLIDQRSEEAFLFNDRYGVNRVYLYEGSDELYFASEAKALLRVVPALRALDDESVSEFLDFGSVGADRTLFRGVRLLPAGSLWVFRRGRCQRRERYFDPAVLPAGDVLPMAAFTESFTDTFRKIIPRYVQPSGAVAVSVTGGLDTRMILSCLPPDARPPCYTYAGPLGETLDTVIGQQVAEACGLEHRLLRLETDFFDSFSDYVDRAVFVSDGTGGATAAHELYLSERASGVAPVRLTGNYGSEVFRGVSTYKRIGLDSSLLTSEFARLSDHRMATADRLDGTRSAAFREVPAHLVGLRAIAGSQLVLRTPFLDNDLVDLALRASADCLATSSPALRLVRACKPELAAIPTDRGVRWPERGPASLVRRAWSEAMFKLDYLDTEGTNPALRGPVRALVRATGRLGLHKPHRFLAYPRWFQGKLADYVRDVTGSGRVRDMPYWNQTGLATIVQEHCRGVRNRTAEINAVLTLAAIDRTLLQDATHMHEELSGSVEVA